MNLVRLLLRTSLIVGLTLSTASPTLAQEPKVTPGGNGNLAFTVPGFHAGRNGGAGPDVLLHDFSLNGKPIQAQALHIRTLSPGVFELTGDNEANFSTENGLPTVVTAGLGAGMSGMALWAADLGGYLSMPTTPDPRLFMRWTEYSAMSPAMETIGTANLGPWDYGDEALANYRKYAVLHMSLFPYRYAAAQEAAKDGMPIMRALALEYQDDKRARETKDEYLFGPDLLVAPVIDENLSRVVYLPKGDWISYWTGEPQKGEQVIVAAAKLDELPLYVRAGAVIPKIPEDTMTLVPSSESGNSTVKSLDERRIYELFPAGSNAAATSLTDFEGRMIKRFGQTLVITGKAAAVTVRFRFEEVHGITVNGKAVTPHKDAFGYSIEFQHGVESTIRWS